MGVVLLQLDGRLGIDGGHAGSVLYPVQRDGPPHLHTKQQHQAWRTGNEKHVRSDHSLTCKPHFSQSQSWQRRQKLKAETSSVVHARASCSEECYQCKCYNARTLGAKRALPAQVTPAEGSLCASRSQRPPLAQSPPHWPPCQHHSPHACGTCMRDEHFRAHWYCSLCTKADVCNLLRYRQARHQVSEPHWQVILGHAWT